MLSKMNAYLSVMGLCLSFVVAGCEVGVEEIGMPAVEKPPAEQEVVLALKFEPGEKAKYKLVSETNRGYRLEQSSQDEVVDERNINRLEMTFTRQIDSVDEQGIAVVTITIDELKYFAQIKNDVKMDLDSSREADKAKLAKLIGQSYKIKLSRDGAAEVIDARMLQKVKGDPAGALVRALFSNESIVKLHSVLALPEKDSNRLRRGDSWSRLRAGPLGMIEPKCYEKTYTLEDVKRCGGQEVAVVKIDAVPSAEDCPDMPEDARGMGIFAKMFDDTSDTYEGKLVLNLDDGKVAEYFEDMQVKWVAMETPPGKRGEEGPDVLTMSFGHLHSIKMID